MICVKTIVISGGAKVPKTDVIIIGSGIAALQLAYNLHQHLHVMIITKNQLTANNSYLAQGGIAAAISKDDHTQHHFLDTMIAGDWHGNEQAVTALVQEGKQAVERFIHAGAPFDITREGTYDLGIEGAHRKPRILHSGGDQTGRKITGFIMDAIAASSTIEWVQNEMVIDLMLNRSGNCIGVKTKNKQDQCKTYFASHVVLATGGAGGLFTRTSNHPSIVGDGIALAYRAGAHITDLEFFQFHPSILTVNGKTIGLISEAIRGAGAKLVNEDGEKIMTDIHPLQDLGPRHIVAYEIYKQLQSGRKIYLDISPITNFQDQFPSIAAMCLDNHIDIHKCRIPVTPGSHFMMGGIMVDKWGCTTKKGLYAIGEVACSGVHGANRLASNSLLEGLVYGNRLAALLLSNKKDTTLDFDPIEKNQSPLIQLPFTKEALQDTMMRHVGIIRNQNGLTKQLNWLNRFALTPFQAIDHKSRSDIETYFMWIHAVLMTESSLLRTESRGAHIRSDFPNKDQINWYKKRIMHNQENNRARITYDKQHQIEIYA
ncbi:L-aspartate oxidase [Virgibacillus massiliensis]|nr:L-aspartate oxidase [Virgibacillus massiliensis]MYL43327.1 L-aspartate oxidase [Virgibacillus massiliensis]